MMLFAYGTLRRGAPMHGLIDGRARWVGPASASGRLIDLGAFPGLVPADAPGDLQRGLRGDWQAHPRFAAQKTQNLRSSGSAVCICANQRSLAPSGAQCL